MIGIKNVTLAACGQWQVILPQLGIDIPKRGQHGPCPACGGKDRFRFDNLEGRGTWFCNQCSPQSGDGLALVKNVTGKSLGEVSDEVAAVLGIDGRQLDPEVMQCNKSQGQALVTKQAAQDERKRQEAVHRAKSIMDNTEPGQRPYLTQRGLKRSFPILKAGKVTIVGIDFTPGDLLIPLFNRAV